MLFSSCIREIISRELYYADTKKSHYPSAILFSPSVLGFHLWTKPFWEKRIPTLFFSRRVGFFKVNKLIVGVKCDFVDRINLLKLYLCSNGPDNLDKLSLRVVGGEALVLLLPLQHLQPSSAVFNLAKKMIVGIFFVRHDAKGPLLHPSDRKVKSLSACSS